MGQRLDLARHDQAAVGVDGALRGADLRLALEQRHGGAAQRQRARHAGADHAAADHQDAVALAHIASLLSLSPQC